MVGETSRWISYDEAATLLGLSEEATKRLVLRRGWPRRSGPTDGTLVAVPDEPSVDESDGDEEGPYFGRIGARPLPTTSNSVWSSSPRSSPRRARKCAA